MSLAHIWKTSPEQLASKTVQQVLMFAGDGVLKDDSVTSIEFRELLTHLDSDTLSEYAIQCLDTSFKDSGLALQDIINQVGNRLGFEVTSGRYRGTSREEDVGFDGLWISPDDDAIVVEVKTTDAYRMSLDVVAQYRDTLISKDRISKNKSSILYVVGRNDTGDLEAQVRGSRHAWDIRLISVDALLHLMKLKEELDDPRIMEKIRDILTPEEYTRVDGIIELVFSTAREVKKEEAPESLETEESAEPKQKKFTPVQFRSACVDRLSKHFGESLVKRSAAIYSTPDNSLGISCTISKPYPKTEWDQYWFGFHPSQKEALEKFEKGFVCFGCGSEENILMVPSKVFLEWLQYFNTTEYEDRFYWHVVIYQQDNEWTFHAKGDQDRFEATKYYLRS